MEKMQGFTFVYKRKDIFVKTSYKNKTYALMQKICQKMQLPDAPSVISDLMYCVQKATCEIRTMKDGRQYYEISGDGFGGRGSFLDDGNTVIIELDK